MSGCLVVVSCLKQREKSSLLYGGLLCRRVIWQAGVQLLIVDVLLLIRLQRQWWW
jgi:hypothetical protein